MARKRASVNARLRAHARKNKANRVPSRAARKRLIEAAIKRFKLFGAYLGQKKSRGRWTHTLSLVCLTTAKLPNRALAKTRRIPKYITWRERGQTYRIPTDVIEASQELTLQRGGAIAGPGDTVRTETAHAMIGAVVMHPNFGVCLTTAGHLFGGSAAVGASALVESDSGHTLAVTVRQCVQDQGIDYTLLSPDVPCDCDNLFKDIVRIGPLFIPEPGHKGTGLIVLDGATDSRRTVCRGVNATLNLPSGLYEDVIVTDAVTDEGESGTALVDSESRVWGFLIGATRQFSVFMPAHTLLRREQSRLL